ncbi:hypothetical protein ACQEVX_06615 [Streptomyces syringium]
MATAARRIVVAGGRASSTQIIHRPAAVLAERLVEVFAAMPGTGKASP